MTASWRKLGLVYCPSGEADWLQSHAAVPIAEHVKGDIFRIYFSSRDIENRSHVGSVLLDIKKPQDILELSSSPILSPGGLGEFDDSGAMASWISSHNGVKFLYYIGWNLGVTVPFRNSIGLAIDEGAGFKKVFNGPIIDRSRTEPHFVASCCVVREEWLWRMWYLSCTGWEIKNGKPEHSYHIKYAESADGKVWNRDGKVSIDYKDKSEFAISRPSVIRDKDCWKMWYSYRGESYRIGYAESPDGVNWNRLDDQAGINVSVSGWDSEMIEYPFVFDHSGDRYMLYNGNDYGRTGFGLAVLG